MSNHTFQRFRGQTYTMQGDEMRRNADHTISVIGMSVRPTLGIIPSGHNTNGTRLLTPLGVDTILTRTAKCLWTLCRAPLHEECPKHHGHKGHPGVTPGTCADVGERAQVILVWVRAPGIGNASHPWRLGGTRVGP